MSFSSGSRSSSVLGMQVITSAPLAKLSAHRESRIVAPAVLAATKRAQEQRAPQNAESLLVMFSSFP